jgi:hypothetical protein
MHISYMKNRSKDVEIASNYNLAIVLGAVTRYNGEQYFYNNFVLPSNPSSSDASATEGTFKYDASTHRPAIRDRFNGGFRVINTNVDRNHSAKAHNRKIYWIVSILILH